LQETTTGILLQGDIRGWTIPIIEQHLQNFPDSEIILSTWDTEDISNIPCKVIQSKLPEPTYPYKSSKNYQIIGSQNGLRNMKSDVILKTRTDIFVHNPKIFDIFFSENIYEKIMYPSLGFIKELRDYWIADFCQLSSRKTLIDFWDSMPLHDGKDRMTPEEYFTRKYVLDIKKDNRPWNITHNSYFIKKRYHEDFQIELEKFALNESYQDDLLAAYVEDPDEYSLYPKK